LISCACSSGVIGRTRPVASLIVSCNDGQGKCSCR
jgi:hypothetical protein